MLMLNVGSKYITIELSKSQTQYFNKINELNLNNPTIIGFGISDKKSFNNACQDSNGAIIGTKFIQSISQGNINESVKIYISSIR